MDLQSSSTLHGWDLGLEEGWQKPGVRRWLVSGVWCLHPRWHSRKQQHPEGRSGHMRPRWSCP